MVSKRKVRLWAQRLLLPRGLQYIPQVELEAGFEKYFVSSNDKNICILHKAPLKPIGSLVILAHPYLADAKKFYLLRGHADMYLDGGFDVVLFDFNGFGESPFIDFDYCGDLKIVADHIKKAFPKFKIFGHGISFGASHLITYAAHTANHFPLIVVENCLDSNLSYYKKRNKKLHWLMLILMRIFPSANKDHNYVKSVANLKNCQKVLFVYNTDDELTTIDMGNKLSSACNVPCELMICKGTHLSAYQDNMEQYRQKLTSFLTN